MTQPDFVPESPTDETWDVIVIGAGMGGGTLGYELARRGLKVLFVEKGRYLFGAHPRDKYGLQAPDEPTERLDAGLWPLRIVGKTNFGPLEMFAPLGCGTGGSTGVYGAQLERLWPADFSPAEHHRAKEANLPEAWPFGYDDLLPYYRQAEALYRVCGTDDPLNSDPEGTLLTPPPMSRSDRAFFDAARAGGLHPYRAHVGCRYVPGCLDCGGKLCPLDCKSDSGNVCVEPALGKHGAKLLSETEALELQATKDRVTALRCRRNGKEIVLRAKTYVVAAGALMTPALLLRSKSDAWPDGLANDSGQVGRNLMMHSSDFVAIQALTKASDHTQTGPAKAISLNDFYLDPKWGKLGTFQSVGVPVSRGSINAHLKRRAEVSPVWYLRFGRAGRIPAAAIGGWLFKSASVYATIVEDLPYSDNRVVADESAPNGMRFHYTYPEELFARNRAMRRLLRKRLPRSVRMMVLSGDNNLNFGHICGTCRSGDDPKKSVTDKYGRCHGLENLYVGDSAVFPTSGGINPSLTIAANALRVADVLAERLGAHAPPTPHAVSDRAER